MGQVPGSITRYNASGFTVVASAEMTNTGRHAQLNFRFSYNAQTNVGRMRVTPLGYTNNFSARGQCARQG